MKKEKNLYFLTMLFNVCEFSDLRNAFYITKTLI